MSAIDKWEYRFKNWKNNQIRDLPEKELREKNKKLLKEYSSKQKIELEKAKSKDVFNTEEVLVRRKLALAVGLIVLTILFIYLAIKFS